MSNAYVTVNDSNPLSAKLTPASTVVVLDSPGRQIDAARVPEKAKVGGVLFWNRVGEAVQSIGFRIIPRSMDNIAHDGIIEFDVDTSL